ncbi:conserved hypothetical protein [Stutzerimonas xanthomarina]|nr:conserved hypothetical protein [Stutzerimonas xanthomarina]
MLEPLSIVQKTHGFGVATRILKQTRCGAASDFNVSGLLSHAEIVEGLFQQNRPTAAARDWQLSTYFYHLSLSGRGIMYSPHWTITAASPACSVAWRT